MRILSTDDTEPVESVDVFVIFDPKSGDIAHVHRVVTFKGGAAPSRERAEDEARTLAQKCGVSMQNLEILHSDRAEFFETGKQYRVDVSCRALVEVPQTDSECRR